MKASMLFNVQDQVCVVTGAASGLGLAMAEVLAANGAIVVMTDIDAPGLRAAAAGVQGSGGRVEPVVLDVCDPAAIHATIAAVAARHGRLDSVFANAGISAGAHIGMPGGALEAVSLERWDKVLSTNLTGVFVTMQAAAAVMRLQRRGRIIVTSSIAGLRGEAIVGYPYAATKAAVANLVRQAALELAPFGVMVNAIAPGVFLTGIADGRLKDPAVAREFARIAPIDRVADPDEIKGLALLLASPASSFITGAVIPIDGGATAC